MIEARAGRDLSHDEETGGCGTTMAITNSMILWWRRRSDITLQPAKQGLLLLIASLTRPE